MEALDGGSGRNIENKLRDMAELLPKKPELHLDMCAERWKVASILLAHFKRSGCIFCKSLVCISL